MRDVRSIGPLEAVDIDDQCIRIAEIYLELAFNSAADISQRSSQASCAPINGCNRGIYWRFPISDGDCSPNAAYGHIVKALETQLQGLLVDVVCRTECLELEGAGGWEVGLVLGIDEAAVRDQSLCDTSDNPATQTLDQGLSELTVQQATAHKVKSPSM